MVPPGAAVADIGTDHAYLPIHLVQSGRVDQVIASDVSSGSLAKARQAVIAAGLEDRISLRLGSGLAVLAPGEASTIIIAGMGPETIFKILTTTPTVVADTEQFLLQPMQNPGRLRGHLNKLGLRLTDEVLVQEGQRFYVIMQATAGDMISCSSELLEVGPCLVAKSDPLLAAYLAHRISQEERIYLEAGASGSKLARIRQQLADRRISVWREILHGCESQLCNEPN
jgi:tRNA (adenine22-N1)-methyltransferase